MLDLITKILESVIRPLQNKFVWGVGTCNSCNTSFMKRFGLHTDPFLYRLHWLCRQLGIFQNWLPQSHDPVIFFGGSPMIARNIWVVRLLSSLCTPHIKLPHFLLVCGTIPKIMITSVSQAVKIATLVKLPMYYGEWWWNLGRHWRSCRTGWGRLIHFSCRIRPRRRSEKSLTPRLLDHLYWHCLKVARKKFNSSESSTRSSTKREICNSELWEIKSGFQKTLAPPKNFHSTPKFPAA